MQKLRMKDWSTVQLAYALGGLQQGIAGSGRRATAGSLLHSPAVANIKSQIKRNRQNQAREQRNKAVRTALKTEAKKVRTAAATGDADAVQQEFVRASRALDRAVSKGILHKSTAARRKSRLARAANAATQAE
jgi:small subunit ribosomal protein S20